MSMQETFISCIEKWTTQDLRAALQKLKLPVTGNNNYLVARLQQYYRSQVSTQSDDEDNSDN